LTPKKAVDFARSYQDNLIVRRHGNKPTAYPPRKHQF